MEDMDGQTDSFTALHEKILQELTDRLAAVSNFHFITDP